MSFAPYAEALEAQYRLLDDLKRFPLSRYQAPKAGIMADADPADRNTLLKFMLEYGTPYWWSRQFCKMLEVTAPSLPDWTFLAEDFLTPEGFMYFHDVLTMPKSTGYGDLPIRAMAWTLIEQHDRAVKPGPRMQPNFEPMRDAKSFIGLAIAFAIWIERNGKTSLFTITNFYENETMLGVLDPSQWDEESTRQVGQEVGKDWVNAATRYFATAIAFLHQKILIGSENPVPRSARRRLERTTPRPLPAIRVIELRRKSAHTTHDPEHEPVEWTCQWIVRGHWRQQWHPKLNTHRPIWIMPFVKGPENKPLRPPRGEVFSVVR